MQGLVIQSTGSSYKVKDEKGKLHICKIKGKFRLQDLKLTNPIAVGDKVNFELGANKNDTPVIDKIFSRKNFICRQSFHKKGHNQIIASNLDLAALISIPFVKDSNLLYIDKFLVTAEFFQITPLIVFNKIDLLNEKEKIKLKNVIDNYNKIGYKTISISALKEEDIDQLKELINNKIVLFTGNSGVGKSTIINKLIPSASQKIGDLSIWNKGKHTTSSSIMFQLGNDTFLIDTPGVQSIYPKQSTITEQIDTSDPYWKKFQIDTRLLIGIDKDKLYYYFPEMMKLPKCKYYNCTHVHEPSCEILKALDKSKISQSRYNNYKKLIDEFDK